MNEHPAGEDGALVKLVRQNKSPRKDFTVYLAHPNSNFNVYPLAEDSAETQRRQFLWLGSELFSRGRQPTAQIVSELADLAPEIADEIQLRLEAYCRIPAETYRATGADRFTPFLVSIPGGRRGRGAA